MSFNKIKLKPIVILPIGYGVYYYIYIQSNKNIDMYKYI